MASKLVRFESDGLFSLIYPRAKSTAQYINHSTIESLKRALQKAWNKIPEKILSIIVKNFCKRLESCLVAILYLLYFFIYLYFLKV